MREVVDFFNLFNPFSVDSKNSILKFKDLEVKNKVAVIALTILTAFATVWMLGLGAVPVFNRMVQKLSPKPRLEPIYERAREIKVIVQETLAPPAKECQPVAAINEQDDAKTIELAKRWAFKVIPEVVPMAKLPLQILKSGVAVQEAIDCYNNGDNVGFIKKAAPLVIGAAAMAYGGTAAVVAGAAAQAYGLGKLVYDTVTHINPAPDPAQAS